MPAHRTQNSRHLRVEAAPPLGAPPINIISPTPRAFIFPGTETSNADADVSSYSFTSTLHASHSLPNLFIFDPSSAGAAESSWTDAMSSTGSQNSMFSSYTDSSSLFTGSSFVSPANSHCGSSHATSPPDSSSTPPLSVSPSPPSPSQSSADGDHQLTSSSPVPYPLPLPPHSNGQVRMQPPRPPNPWICFRNVRSAQYKSTGEFPKLDKKGRGASAPSSPAAGPIGLDGEARRPRQADLSKHISLEWKALTDEEKAPYVRMSEEAKIIHAKVYPGYKYQPRRKLDGADSTKKSMKPKKSSKKSSKGTRKTVVAVGVAEHPSEQSQVTGSGGAVAITLPALGVDVALQGEDLNGDEQSKEWTWLPDQTLLPFSWDIDQEHESSMDDVMHQLDANVEDQGDNDDDMFRDPFFLSFPPLDPESETMPFFSVPELQEEPALLPDGNYNFPTSSALGLQVGFFEDHTTMPHSLEPPVPTSFDAGLRRDSLSNAYPEVSSGNQGVTVNLGYEGATGNEASSVPPRSSTQDVFMSLPQFGARAVAPARRGSVPSHSHSSSDGLLRPPYISRMRSQGRSRRSSVPMLTSTSLGPLGDEHDMRSIPTSDFNTSSGITTSILIPKRIQCYDMEMERNLADYSLALGSMDPQTPAAKSMPSVPSGASDANPGVESAHVQADELSPSFDFDAEFGDIIDTHANRSGLS